VLLRSHKLNRKGGHLPKVSFPPTQSNMDEIVVLCYRNMAILFERSSRGEKLSPLLDDNAFLPFQGKGDDSSASSTLSAQDADDLVQSPFVTEYMPVEFEDFEFRDVAETGRHLGVCSVDPEQAARVARTSAAGPAPNLSIAA
jgi:hypothetical protein